MLIVAGTLTAAPGERERVLELAQEVIEATRKEDGCHDYVFSPDLHDPDLIRLYELWEGQEQLDAHLESPHIAAWRDAGSDLLTGRSIRIFTVSDSREL